MLKKSIISCAMIGVVALALASSGGGDKKRANTPLKPEFTPIRTTNGFTLKAGPSYTGSQVLGSERSRNYLTFKSLITYEQGNKVIILPSSVKVNTTIKPSLGKSNLNVVDLKFRLRK
ncbi:MAG: hypothetical protein P0Y53_23235 [Candidatus Pseudobacter hemicellulosilyticus]|uniref:Uncharacterized protein n=1 Tax=Candidatus Pseudobacter hemicellulosilyticus TaxID=3121375 RepID=A0AAJ5WTL1_9BACT|nr:MAG: hypothetical protein P0Y53_23235 [Pseudobacter sp.]